MGLDKIAETLTTVQVLIAFIVMSCIASAEAGIIFGLIKRVGSIKNLFSITSNMNKYCGNNAENKGSKSANCIKKKERF